MSQCEHVVVEGRKPGSQHCKKCSWTYPCREESCGHLDCIEFRAKLPRCHLCGARVEGPCGAYKAHGSQLPELAGGGVPEGSWTIWALHGMTRAVHYACLESRVAPVPGEPPPDSL